MEPRRDQQQPSDQSGFSFTPTVFDRRSINLSEMSKTASLLESAAISRQDTKLPVSLEGLDSHTILTRGLTIHSKISTHSSFARRQKAHVSQAKPPFNEIGSGIQGVVFEVTGTERVVKCAKDSHQQSLRSDYEIHRLVAKAFEKHSELLPNVVLPKPVAFYEPSSASGREWWKENGPRFPSVQHQAPSNVIVSQRILSLLKAVRRALIDQFIPANHPSEKSDVLNDPTQKHCLVRPYLGDRLMPDELPRSNFNLRNLALYSNQLEDVGLDLILLAKTMASALAVMHWGAGIDADDVEFVLGSQAETPNPTQVHFQHRTTNLFLLDFGRCKQAGLDEAGVKRRILMFLHNDEYYPRPHSDNAKDEECWNAFKGEYLSKSRTILDPSQHIYPELFIYHIEDEVGKKMAEYNQL